MDGVDPSSPVPGMGHDAGSKVASMFYQTILDSKVFWDNTMEFEGTTKFTLPRSNGEQLNVCAQPHADNTNCRAEQGRTGCASRTRRGTTSCATRSSARTLGKLPRCRQQIWATFFQGCQQNHCGQVPKVRSVAECIRKSREFQRRPDDRL